MARERGLIDDASGDSKRKIRDRIRQLPDGEIEWQKCQAQLYASRIGEATLMDGVAGFFQLCRERRVKAYVVSHKTKFSRYDTTGTNLQEAARQWMAAHLFFAPDGFGLAPADVFFAQTRQEKIDRIRDLGCTHFIDDLEETFLEKTFPPHIARILYEPARVEPPPPGVMLMRTWQEICDYFFAAN